MAAMENTRRPEGAPLVRCLDCRADVPRNMAYFLGLSAYSPLYACVECFNARQDAGREVTNNIAPRAPRHAPCPLCNGSGQAPPGATAFGFSTPPAPRPDLEKLSRDASPPPAGA